MNDDEAEISRLVYREKIKEKAERQLKEAYKAVVLIISLPPSGFKELSI
ncbi:hypothetical protein [Paenibacillus sp. FSL K6-2524]